MSRLRIERVSETSFSSPVYGLADERCLRIQENLRRPAAKLELLEHVRIVAGPVVADRRDLAIKILGDLPIFLARQKALEPA